jgi:hypothetical protein
MAATQTSLFARHHILPKGFDHKDEVLSPDRECVLVGQFAQLPFKEFEFQGFLGRRRVVSFGWRYDFSRRELQKADEIPDFLLPSDRDRIRRSRREPIPASPRHRIFSRRGHWMAQRPTGIRTRHWSFPAFSVSVSTASEEGQWLGTSGNRTSASFSIPAERIGTH